MKKKKDDSVAAAAATAGTSAAASAPGTKGTRYHDAKKLVKHCEMRQAPKRSLRSSRRKRPVWLLSIQLHPCSSSPEPGGRKVKHDDDLPSYAAAARPEATLPSTTEDDTRNGSCEKKTLLGLEEVEPKGQMSGPISI